MNGLVIDAIQKTEPVLIGVFLAMSGMADCLDAEKLVLVRNQRDHSRQDFLIHKGLQDCRDRLITGNWRGIFGERADGIRHHEK